MGSSFSSTTLPLEKIRHSIHRQAPILVYMECSKPTAMKGCGIPRGFILDSAPDILEQSKQGSRQLFRYSQATTIVYSLCFQEKKIEMNGISLKRSMPDSESQTTSGGRRKTEEEDVLVRRPCFDSCWRRGTRLKTWSGTGID
jgi:hypothetical protein